MAEIGAFARKSIAKACGPDGSGPHVNQGA